MRKIQKIFSVEKIIICAIIIFSVFVSFWPTIEEYRKRSGIVQNRVYEPIYGFAWDYHAYLSKIQQGFSGNLLVYEKYTTEKYNPSFLQIFYLLSGKVGAMAGLTSSAMVYHFSRIFWGICWFVSGYFFIRFVFNQSKTLRACSFLLFVFSGNFPKLITDINSYGVSFLGSKWDLYLSGWTHMNPVFRPAFVPHWNAGHTFTALTLLFIIKALSVNSSKKKILFSSLAGFSAIISGFILPPTLIISQTIFASYTIYIAGLTWIKEKSLKNLWQNYKYFLIFWIFSIIPLGYNLWITSFYPWKALIEGDMYITRYVFQYGEYLKGLGIISYLGILGALLCVIAQKKRMLWAGLWVITAFGLIIVFDKILVWHNQTRFVQVGIQLPLSILSIYFLHQLFFFTKKWRMSLTLSAVIIILIPSLLIWKIGFIKQTDYLNQKRYGLYPAMMIGGYDVYPVKELYSALAYLDNQQTKKNVFSGPSFGNYLGAYTNKFAYIGHGAQTVKYYQEKLPAVVRFYKKEMNKEEAIKIFKNHQIGYVFFGPEEREWGKSLEDRDYLRVVFKEKDFIIYEVI